MEFLKNRDAYFQSVIAFVSPEEQTTIFSGKVKGKISSNEKGMLGFGYDPIFEPLTGNNKTFAEMPLNKKNKYSHRAKALRKFGEWYSSINKRRS